ncbi:PF05258 family protein [Halobacteriovorax sp. BALOs_7]|uniref:DUF721 domain-containing protein n=1 Tax=Halobacteriovorax vibrionivorans TaxID=2152716 RepID=A0ABY0IG65_9BACT|nr:PF05258 family protein [Halobacteriovorax sp. BALOs_7]RZF21923.1 DUF721 domain-containing protein [Halobacteriovorax vibrionivorans]TGD47235.1 DUF721 domain-containing protein [Halobacteriovorax sp. Y22]
MMHLVKKLKNLKNLKDVLKDIDSDFSKNAGVASVSSYGSYGNKQSNFKANKAIDLFDFLELSSSWNKIVGPRLSQFTIPLKLKNKSLTILTSHPVYAQQLKYMETEIIKSIGNVLPATKGQIKKIFFQVDNQFFQKKKSEVERKEIVKQEVENRLHPQSPEYKAIMRDAQEQFSDIEDEELKKSLTSILMQLRTKK